MYAVSIDLKKSLESGEDLGSSSVLSIVGMMTSGQFGALEELYSEANSGRDFSDEDFRIYERKVFELFAKYTLAQSHVKRVNFGGEGEIEPFKYEDDRSDEEIRKAARGLKGAIGTNLAKVIEGLRSKNLAQVLESCESFKQNSINNGFVLDLKRSHAEIVLADGTSKKMYDFLGYDDYEQLRVSEDSDVKKRFVDEFRKQGLSDHSIANIAMNMNQKSLLAGHAYSPILVTAENREYPMVEPKRRRDKIRFSTESDSVTMSSSSEIGVRSMDNPEELVPAMLTSWSYTIPRGESAGSTKTFDEIMSSTLGCGVVPLESKTQLIVRPGFQPPKLSPSCHTKPLDYAELDEILPPSFSSIGFTIKEVRETFSELFQMQRGGAFSLGVEGRLLDIINLERETKGARKFNNLDYVPISPRHVDKLVDLLAHEQRGHLGKDVNIEMIKKQTKEAVALRSRINTIDPSIKLNLDFKGPKFQRFNAMYEFWEKTKKFLGIGSLAKSATLRLNFEEAKPGEAVKPSATPNKAGNHSLGRV